MFEKETLFYFASNIFDEMLSSNFYCLEDPTFYKKGKMLGCIISHEPMVVLYLTSVEKNNLIKKGVVFDL